MRRAAIGTIGARVAVAAAQLMVAALAAHLLGLAEVGRMSLLVLAIAFVILAINIVGGGALVYLEPRHGTRTLRWIAYGWALLMSAMAALLLEPLGLSPEGLGLHAAALALLEAIGTIHLTLLLGRERFAQHNALMLGRTLLLVASFIVLLRVGGPAFVDYIAALYIAHGGTALLSALVLSRQPGTRTDPTAAFMAMLRQGLPAQAANGLQLLNYRLSYFLVQRFHGAAPLGLWAITTQLAESTWLAPKSLGTVLYARVSNLDEATRQRDLTLTVMKASVAVAVAAVSLLVLLPGTAFTWVFGPEAIGIRRLVALLAPGLLAMAASQALSHYLSGTGRVRHNTIGSGLALLITSGLGITLIPALGAEGAAITASVAYSASLIYQVVVFNRISGAGLKDYLPNGEDGDRVMALIRKLLGR
ncbi:MAG: polysaccharide biosynthesis C-terminal domain-containing protein [Flavobacteriales bacterium]|jgi:O-antigen/teichoic acid export membrane protein|nr:polysaccharide biosynthesis C-terminal domain-containing protein [Flavobacteriales bacterium]